jgi:hypothetical protein
MSEKVIINVVEKSVCGADDEPVGRVEEVNVDFP